MIFNDGIRYNSISTWLKQHFGSRIVKLSLDGGFTCPNRDGRCGIGGCSFCSEAGSGDFASGTSGRKRPNAAELHAAMDSQAALTRRKWPDARYLAYFQNFTNTYAPVAELRQLWDAALAYPNTIGLAIATRPDCLPADVLDLLEEFRKKTFIWVELGLQTSNEATARSFNRGYDNKVFEEACTQLTKRKIPFVVHLIMGLPGEKKEDMLASGRYVAAFKPFGVKLHMLHLMKGTPMAREVMAQQGCAGDDEPQLLDFDQYVDIVCDILELMPPQTTIHRLTGDAPKEALIAPLWTGDKHKVLNEINRRLSLRGSEQGIRYEEI